MSNESETRVSIPPLPRLMLEPVVRAALLEDLGRAGDITTQAVVPATARSRLALVARQRGVLAGLELALPWAELALRRAAEVWAVWRTSAATAEPERLCPLMAELAEWAPYSATG